MVKKALMNASVASMICQFNKENIGLLEGLGYQVDVAANFGSDNPMRKEDVRDFWRELRERNSRIIETACPRNPKAIGRMLATYRQLKRLADKEHYDLVHTQSPVGGVLCRLAFRRARKNGTKVIYTAHGFHFYKGAPLKNWLLYYPAEKLCSRFTDVLITINKEDYALAKRKFHAKKTVYVPGVGIDAKRFSPRAMEKEQRQALRTSLGIPEDAVWVLSVGELNPNKNHATMIRALAALNAPSVHYAIAGMGSLETKLQELAKTLGISERVHLLGYQANITEWYHVADLFAFPSKREGLPVALMEAMASGLPVVCSNIRGNTDLIDEGKGGYLFEPTDVNSAATALKKAIAADRAAIGKYNREKIQAFDGVQVGKAMKRIYEG